MAKKSVCSGKSGLVVAEAGGISSSTSFVEAVGGERKHVIPLTPSGVPKHNLAKPPASAGETFHLRVQEVYVFRVCLGNRLRQERKGINMKVFTMIAAAGLASTAMAAGELGATQDSMFSADGLARGTSNFTETINFVDLESWDALGSPNNSVLSLNIGAGNTITGIGWDVEVETVGASWLSEPVFRFADSTGADAGLFLTVGAGNDAPGTMMFSSGGVLDLSDNGIPNITLADGILQIELFEGYDDVPGAVDAFLTGSLTLGLLNEIPAPGAAALFGLGGLAAARRRR